jgi:hypothetical protein
LFIIDLGADFSYVNFLAMLVFGIPRLRNDEYYQNVGHCKNNDVEYALPRFPS